MEAKIIFICALALVIQTCNAGYGDPSQATSICARPGSNGVLVAHEECNKFYKCSAGVPVALECPDNLLYNYEKEYCDWPENVKCDRKVPAPETGGNGDPSLAPEICARPGSNGVLVAHEECNKFYKCAGGVPVAISCQLNLLYNPEKEYCDWPENVNCQRQGNALESSYEVYDGYRNATYAAIACSRPFSDGILLAHEDCSRFYICAGSKPVTMNCPPYLLFNPRIGRCDWPEDVDCPGKEIPGDIPDNINAICAQEGTNGKKVPHKDCDKFYVCAAGHVTLFFCPKPLLFNPLKDVCDWPEKVNCQETKLLVKIAKNHEKRDANQAAAVCDRPHSDGALLAHENCTKYYICSANTPVEMDCPPYLLFNPRDNRCDWPEKVDCPGKELPGGNIPDGVEAICAQEGTNGKKVPHDDCDKFYVCAAGHVTWFICPPYLLFNAAKEICDWPENVTCN